jgi:hypothetical protein
VPIYSVLFSLTTVSTTADAEQFAADPANTAVLRDVEATNSGAGAPTLLIGVFLASGPAAYVIAIPLAAAPASSQWTGRLVLPPGTVVKAHLTAAGAVGVAFSGYQFSS